MKKICLILLLGCMMTLTMLTHAKPEPITVTTEMSGSCISYATKYDDYLKHYVINFTNKCDKDVTVSYQYEVTEKDGTKRWYSNTVSVRAFKKNEKNNAGNGNVKNVREQ